MFGGSSGFILRRREIGHWDRTLLLEPVKDEHMGIAIRKGDLEFLRWLDVFVSTSGAQLEALRQRYLVGQTWTKLATLNSK